jgi:hypothetical protein
MVAAGIRGERGRATRGTDCPHYLELGRLVEEAPLELAAAGGGVRGGGTAGPGRELAVASRVVVVADRAEGPFYRRSEA